MDFAALSAVEQAPVELLEFSWPPPSEEQDSYTCTAYVVMRRPHGFLLCVPEGFLTAEELEQGQQAGATEGIGPSLSLEAPVFVRTLTGEWEASPNKVAQAVVVDLSDQLVSALGPGRQVRRRNRRAGGSGQAASSRGILAANAGNAVLRQRMSTILEPFQPAKNIAATLAPAASQEARRRRSGLGQCWLKVKPWSPWWLRSLSPPGTPSWTPSQRLVLR